MLKIQKCKNVNCKYVIWKCENLKKLEKFAKFKIFEKYEKFEKLLLGKDRESHLKQTEDWSY